MRIEHLSLSNFRNYARLEWSPPPGTTLIHGANAQGKTSLLEAICYLALSRSPWSSSDRQLIHWRAQEQPIPYARLAAEISSRHSPLERLGGHADAGGRRHGDAALQKGAAPQRRRQARDGPGRPPQRRPLPAARPGARRGLAGGPAQLHRRHPGAGRRRLPRRADPLRQTAAAAQRPAAPHPGGDAPRPTNWTSGTRNWCRPAPSSSPRASASCANWSTRPAAPITI